MNNGGVPSRIDEQVKEGLSQGVVVFEEAYVKWWLEERNERRDVQRKFENMVAERLDDQHKMTAKLEASWAERRDKQDKVTAKLDRKSTRLNSSHANISY